MEDELNNIILSEELVSVFKATNTTKINRVVFKNTNPDSRRTVFLFKGTEQIFSMSVSINSNTMFTSTDFYLQTDEELIAKQDIGNDILIQVYGI